ncbi:MAG: 2-oxoacid ferredoxin oxidoreductase [bacterium]|nr:MAG: 2-oxoacid ferredoxin oxidoreductase [bacterium]
MPEKKFDMGPIDIAWCPGCGNFSILGILKETLARMGMGPEEVVLVSGIGQAAKIPHYLKCHFFNGLHGRALPAATAIKAANPGLVVIAESGDGDMYGEGGNHFIHSIRRNPDITNVVHNNMVYGLTKGQASPTSQIGFVTPVQTHGVFEEPFNPLAVAIALNASFVARAFAGDREQTSSILEQAISHRGYALVDILQPCVTFNRVNTHQWFRENTFYVDDSHDVTDRQEAFRIATEQQRLPLGILFVNRERVPFEEKLPAYREDRSPLYARETDLNKLADAVRAKG